MVRLISGATVLAMAVAAAGADAQPPVDRPERGGRARMEQPRRMKQGDARPAHAPMSPVRELLRGVELTEAQKLRVRDIHLKYRGRHEALADTLRANRAVGIAADSTMRLRFERMAEQERGEIRGVLNAEQQKTFDGNVTFLKERRERMREGRGRAMQGREMRRPRGGPRG